MPDFITHIGLTHYIIVATLLFTIGLAGVLTGRNVVRVLMSVELMLSAVNINLVAFNNYSQTGEVLLGQVFAIFVLTVSAAEASVGLAIVIALYRARATADMEDFNLLKW
ncbi:NADH-quinone oxidoreductase subunit NuoK [Vampirovibrio sp.]|uniref:NADH-quinone oxidoreductase subunit NuoK n=1 Tax=Vampirovibrio sp. TaxID=2717857 RepID=UPI003594902F